MGIGHGSMGSISSISSIDWGSYWGSNSHRGSMDIGGGSGSLNVDIRLSGNLDIHIGLSGDLLMDIGLGGNLGIDVGLGSNLLMDIGLGGRVEVGIGYAGVVESVAVETMDRSGSVGHRGSSHRGSHSQRGSGSVAIAIASIGVA